MADTFEVYFKRQMLQQTLGVGTPTLALYTDDGATELTETGYSRQPLAVTVTVTEPILARNSADVTFGPAVGDWPTITHVGVFDDAGELLCKKTLTTPVAPLNSETFEIIANALEVGFV